MVDIDNDTQEPVIGGELNRQEVIVAYYSYARGVLDGKGIPVIPLLAEAFAMYGVDERNGAPPQDIWDDFIDSETGTAILAASGVY